MHQYDLKTCNLLPCYLVTVLPCYRVTLLPYYLITLLPCYLVTLLPCYIVTLLLCLLFLILWNSFWMCGVNLWLQEFLSSDIQHLLIKNLSQKTNIYIYKWAGNLYTSSIPYVANYVHLFILSWYFISSILIVTTNVTKIKYIHILYSIVEKMHWKEILV